MSPVQKRIHLRDSGKRKEGKKESESDPAREKTSPVDPTKKYRNVKEKLPNIGDPLPEKGDKLISIKRNGKTRTIEALITLVNINNYTIEGYETISQRTNNQELKILFSRLARSGEKRKQKLITTIEKMNKPANSRNIPGIKFLRMWMFVKAALGKFNNQPQAKIIHYEKN